MAPFNPVGLTAVTVIIWFVIRRLYFNPVAKVPGPWYTKWTNIVSKIETLRANGPIYVEKLHKKYGPVVRLGPNEVDVTDLEATKKIHRVKADFVKADFYKGFATGQENIFNTRSNDFHRRHRKLLSQPMSESSLKSMQPQIEEKVRLAIRKMGEEMSTRKAVDVCKWWMFMTTDIIGQLTFGKSFQMLENGKIDGYMDDLRTAGIVGTFGSQFASLIGILQHLPIPGVGGSVKTLELRMRAFAKQRLQEVKDALSQSDGNMKPLLFTKLIQGKTVDGESLSETEVLGDAEAYIIAGSDTTSNTLTYVTWALCEQPELRDQLVKELQGLPENFTSDDLKVLPFLNSCITEGLRRFPVVPGGLPRLVPKEGAELSGYWLPGGATVTTQTWSLHRNPEIFPDPDRYDPSRWENPTKAMKDSWMPFGGGSRICIGMHLAYIELRLGLAHFFRTFPNSRVSAIEGMSKDDMKQALYFIASPQHHRCLIEAA